MDPERDDHVLNVLRSFASGAELSVGLGITVLCGPARIQGMIAGTDAYTEHLGEVVSRAFRERANADDDERAAHLAEVYAKDRYVATNERRRARRRAIAERLRAVNLSEDTADVADLEAEEQHLGGLTPILILRDARVWGPGGDADTVPFVRIPVAAISAWWLETPQRGSG